MKEPRPTITIKLKPYLQEFVLSEMNYSQLASSEYLIGKLIRPFLQVRPRNIPPSFPTGPEYLTFELPLYQNFNLRSNYYISEHDQAIIEILLAVHFKKIFYQFMSDKVRFDKHNFQTCIYQFCSDNNFSLNHINQEMLKKAFYRYRKKDPKYKKKVRYSCHGLSRKSPESVPYNLNTDLLFLNSEK
jgi:hypothetical protein